MQGVAKLYYTADDNRAAEFVLSKGLVLRITLALFFLLMDFVIFTFFKDKLRTILIAWKHFLQYWCLVFLCFLNTQERSTCAFRKKLIVRQYFVGNFFRDFNVNIFTFDIYFPRTA